MKYLLRPSRENNHILFIGSSMVWDLIDPLVVQKATGLSAYNLGLEGANVVYFNMVYRKYLSCHPKPAYIVMNVDYRSFDTEHKMFNFPCYVPYLKDSIVAACLLPYYPQYIPGPERWWQQIRLINSKPDADKIWNLKGLLGAAMPDYGLQPDSSRGFHPFDYHWGNMGHDVPPFRAICTASGLHILREIISSCRKEHIRLILVGSPLYNDYHKIVLNGNSITDSIQRIAKDEGIPYWLYTDCRLSRDTTYFYNFGHLNKTGACIYSQMLANDLKQLLTDSNFMQDSRRWLKPE